MTELFRKMYSWNHLMGLISHFQHTLTGTRPHRPRPLSSVRSGWVSSYTHTQTHTMKKAVRKILRKACRVGASNAARLHYPYHSRTQTHALNRTEGSVVIHMKKDWKQKARMLFPKDPAPLIPSISCMPSFNSWKVRPGARDTT